MALQATEQGSHPPATADLHPAQRPLALGGTGCQKRIAVAGIPDDALVEILSRLPAKFLCRSKCVSKAWCDLIAGRLRCRKLPHALEGFFHGCVDSDSDDDDVGCPCTKCKPKPHTVHGHFTNLSGRSVPLVDPLFSSLRKQPGIKKLTLLDSCNGLLLFGHKFDSGWGWGWVGCDTTSYIVYNPVTEHWLLVPSSGFRSTTSEDEDSDDDVGNAGVSAYLIFDPVASLHFELIEFCFNSEVAVVHTYSSETKTWVDRMDERWEEGGGWDLRRTITSMRGSTFFKKMLHLIIIPSSMGPELIAAIDGTGQICRVIQWLDNRGCPVFVGQSKGLLHCLSVTQHPDGNNCHIPKLSIWVLEDYDAEEWNLKHTVGFSEIFGKEICQFASDYNVVTIHPDCNVVFFVQHGDYKLISYDLDRKEVCVLCTVGCDYGIIMPYVPYFSEVPVLSKKH